MCNSHIKKLNWCLLFYNTSGDSIKNMSCLLATVLSHVFFYYFSNNRNSNFRLKEYHTSSFPRNLPKMYDPILPAKLSLGYLAQYVIFYKIFTLCSWLLHHISNMRQHCLCPCTARNPSLPLGCYETWMPLWNGSKHIFSPLAVCACCVTAN